MIKFSELQDKVISPGYCIGCGACCYANSEVKMALTHYGEYIPISKSPDAVVQGCPFSDEFPDEDFLSEYFLAQGKKAKHIGNYQGLYAGYVSISNYRRKGSSGGSVSWLASRLLELDLVDGVVHVGEAPDGEGGAKFTYKISKSVSELKYSSKSRYYPITLDEVLDQISNSEERYAVVGLPCFIKAVRQLTYSDDKLRSNIKYLIGLVCGHLKSANYSDFLAWQVLGKYTKDYKIDFRAKLQHRPANSYGVSVAASGKEKIIPMVDLLGGNWGMGEFKIKACDFCDDVLAETADVAIGDAWLDEYKSDYKGTNIVMSRNETITNIIADGIEEGDVIYDEVSVSKIIESQSSGIKHRSEGLTYRLSVATSMGINTPKKRKSVLESSVPISSERQSVYMVRESIRDISRAVFVLIKTNGDTQSLIKEFILLKKFYNGRQPVAKKISSIIKINTKRLVRKVTFTYSKIYK